MNKDLTQGNPRKVLWAFCLPMFGSIVFQQLYNIADSLVAGKFIGEGALAAVGNSYNITLIFIAFAFGCNIGCSVIVSQLFGAKDYRTMKSSVYTALIASGVLCAALMLGGLASCDTLLRLMKTQPEVMADSALYLDIYIWGLPFLFFYNIATGIFSALGDSRTPFLFLALSSTANILIDILFVKGFSMGISGVAWATFLCQGASCILSLALVLKRLRDIRTETKVLAFSWSLLGKIAVVAIPSILQQSFISVGNMLIQGRINSFGVSVAAGYSAAVKLNNLVITSFTTIGNGISNFAAQNLGAARFGRIREGFRAGWRLVWCLCVPFCIAYVAFGRYLLLLFMDRSSQTALQTGREFLWILSPFYFVVSVKLVADGILRGTSAMGQFMVATFTDLILRVVLSFLLSGWTGSALGIWCSWPVGWTIATGMSLFFYRRACRRLGA
ncbi:MATE family efflux transporter [uncultured Acetatifactor sp.]|uniref:MATE family efflux transporter n=1 Tax=uncultured Acetatifactor sp. TaxID=1671927 RepID=UPI002626D1BD|nr:MATE family efflux transporter [uncultured Acetatifactor sp.]